MKRCAVCELRSHAKWHEVARGEINPIALIQFVEGLRGSDTPVVSAITGYICAVTGMDVPAMRAMLEAEKSVDAVAGEGEVL